jgi:calcium-dependent protein kinase
MDCKKLEREGTGYKSELLLAWRMNYRYIVKLHAIFKDEKKLYLVMEILTGGSLLDKVVGKQSQGKLVWPQRGLDMPLVAQYIWQIVLSMAYLHHHKICHRDLKPENFMLRSSEAGAPLKLIDFGFACQFHKGTPMTERIGSSYCVAPEVIMSPAAYDEKCDVWSIGVITYIICVGRPPIIGEDKMAVLRKVLKGEFEFKDQDWTSVNTEARRACEEMMQLDAAKRPSAKRLILYHANWLQEVGHHLINTPESPDHKRRYEPMANKKSQPACCVIH